MGWKYEINIMLLIIWMTSLIETPSVNLSSKKPKTNRSAKNVMVAIFCSLNSNEYEAITPKNIVEIIANPPVAGIGTLCVLSLPSGLSTMLNLIAKFLQIVTAKTPKMNNPIKNNTPYLLRNFQPKLEHKNIAKNS